jgi:hypothetical protein
LEDIEAIIKNVGLTIKNQWEELESQKYNAAQFEINGLKVIYRLAKQTPKKIGQFVTCWKRDKEGLTTPFHEKDDFDYYFIQTKSEIKNGLFIFPKSILVEKRIVSISNREGKRGFRVYPPWDKPESKQAINTQKWQIKFYFDSKEHKKLKELLGD